MRFTTVGCLLVSAAAFIAPAAGQNPPAPPATVRTAVAATKLPMLGDAPVHFKAVSVTIPSGTSSSVSSTNGIVYQLSGSTEVSIGGEVKTLSPGEGLFIADGNVATLKAGDGEPSTLLHFLLVSPAELVKFVATLPFLHRCRPMRRTIDRAQRFITWSPERVQTRSRVRRRPRRRALSSTNRPVSSISGETRALRRLHSWRSTSARKVCPLSFPRCR